MRFRLRPLVILVCILLSGIVALRFPSYAHAQEPDEEDPTALRMARQRFQEGVKYFDAGQYSKARAAFLQAYALKKHPSVLLNLAQSELRAGYEAEAANHFAQYLRETDGSNSAQVTKAQAGLDKAKAKVGQLTLAADVEDAYVLVDGKLQGRTPLPGPLYLSPGTHMLGVRLGGKSVTRQVTAVPGESITEMVNLTKAGSPAPNAAAPPAAEEEQQGAPPPVAITLLSVLLSFIMVLFSTSLKKGLASYFSTTPTATNTNMPRKTRVILFLSISTIAAMIKLFDL